MNNDADLLRQFAEMQDEKSFATVVERHLGFVYAVCLRRLHNTHAAQDATQAVFVALARKANTVARGPNVIGWLHRSACYETRNIVRAQANRLARESEAQRLGTTLAGSRMDLEGVDALLDDALAALPDRDREIILARYFLASSYAEIGVGLRLTENAARMRVERAIAKLRDQLERNGITSTAAALGSALPAYASTTVPSGLLAGITKASVLATASGTSLAMTYSFMSTTKVVTGILVAAAVGGALYERHQASEVRAGLVQAQADSASSSQQLLAARHEITELKQRTASSQPLTPALAPQAKPLPNDVRTTPTFQNLLAVQAKPQLDSRYGPFFKALQLRSDTVDRLKSLLIEKQQATRDAMNLAVQQDLGKDPLAAGKAVGDAATPVNQQIQALLGDAGFAELRHFEGTILERATVTQLQLSLGYTSAPLTDAQCDQLTQLIARNSATPGRFNISSGGPLFSNDTALVTDQDIEQARGFLDTQQLAALKDLQAAQIANDQMQKMVRHN